MTEALLAELRLLRDERDITRTLYAYGHTLDYGDEAGFIDCWTEDAMLWWPGPGEMRGHEALRKGFRAHTHAPELFHKHLVMAPMITIDGDTATVASMMARLDPYDGMPAIRAYGRYLDKLRRCADGKWRICERIPEVEGWRKGEVPSASAARPPGT